MPDQERPPLTPAERRARREARRAAQRVANVGRAEKMHQARLAWESAADRPPDAGEKAALRQSTAAAGIKPASVGRLLARAVDRWADTRKDGHAYDLLERQSHPGAR